MPVTENRMEAKESAVRLPLGAQMARRRQRREPGDRHKSGGNAARGIDPDRPSKSRRRAHGAVVGEPSARRGQAHGEFFALILFSVTGMSIMAPPRTS